MTDDHSESPNSTTVAPVIDYDHRDEESQVDPWPKWERMRRSGAPVAYTQAYGGFYVLPSYHEVTDAVRDATTFSSALNQTTIPMMPVPPLPPIHTDPPEQRQWRELINSFFSPARVAEYEPWMREIIDEIIDPLLAHQEIDVPHDIGLPVTRRVILRLLGILEEPEDLNEWVDDIVFAIGERAEKANALFMGYLAEEIGRRRQTPGGDIISALFERKLRDEDRYITDDEMLKLIMLLLAAALETTSSAISATVMYLLEHPDTADQLEGDPEIWPHAMDEFVRWVSPAPCMARTARYDTEIGGCPIPAGSRVMLLYGSANHDDQEFANPDEVVLDRHPNRHLGFGMGPHRCLGSHLAKAQMALTIKKLLPELDKWQVGDRSKIAWNASVTRGMTCLPLVRK
jgi:cytochrome P450